jgi:hypothetical protein
MTLGWGTWDESRLELTWKVENEPDVEALLGGLPRPFPAIAPLLFGQADDTAGPCRRRARVFSPDDGVTAERGSADMIASEG